MPAPVEQLTCARDGTSTRLTCVECHTPICPLCLVRSPVGMKCATCAEPGRATPAPKARSKWLLLAPVGVLALVAAAVTVPRLLASDEPKQRETVNPFAEARPALPYTFGGIGREVIDGNLSFLVKAVECGATQVVGATTRTAQGKFCFVTLTVRNVSRTSVTLDSGRQTLADGVDGTGRRYSIDPPATTTHPANASIDMLMPVVNPGNELTGVLVYDVPPDAKPRSVSLFSGAGGFGAIIALPA